MVGYVVAFLKLSGLPRRLQVSLYALAGVILGVAFVTARVTNATSYLGDEPETCMNCHVMTDAYASWQRGSHGRVAVCTDCHVPHSSAFANLRARRADLILLDVMFPDDPSRGFCLARELKTEHEDLKDIPLLMVTAINAKSSLGFGAHDIDETWLPVSDFLEKPIDLSELDSKVQTALAAAGKARPV